MSKKLSNYIAAFYYFNKNLIVLSEPSGGVSIISFSSIIGAPVGIAGESFNFVFSFTTKIVRKLLKSTRNKKKIHHKCLCWLE